MKKLLLLLLLLVPITAESSPVTLEYRLPTTNTGRTFDLEFGDSVPDCGLTGGPLTDLRRSYLIGVPAVGGNPLGIVLRTHTVAGMEGLIDTFLVDNSFGYHYWVETDDTWGNRSCSSNTVYVGPITGVTPDGESDEIVGVMFFDVQGRRVIPSASGIYFERTKFKSGKKITRKIVIIK